MIGWYIHHQGAGHLHRATTLAGALGEPVTGLSSLPRPGDQWPGAWLQLARDDDPAVHDDADPTAAGALHWVPAHHPGLRRRMAQISSWIEETNPRLMVVDVSVEVARLARLHGVPVVTVALPGDRRDPAHELGYSVSSAICGFWPPDAQDMVRGPAKLHAMGAVSRFSPADTAPRSAPAPAEDPQRIVVLNGRGGGTVPVAALEAIRQGLPEAELTILGGETGTDPSGTWVEDPWPHLQGADVVITAAGQNSVAEVAASRTPAVVVPLPRPHGEQEAMHRVLTRGPWPAVAAPQQHLPETWRRALHQAWRLNGAD